VRFSIGTLGAIFSTQTNNLVKRVFKVQLDDSI
jgi:hypothetical protein